MRVVRITPVFEVSDAIWNKPNYDELVQDYDLMGGQQIHTSLLSRQLAKAKDIEQHVITRGYRAERGQRALSANLFIHYIPPSPKRWLSCWPGASSPHVVHLVNRLDPDLVHYHTGEDLCVVPLVQWIRYPSVLTIHSSWRYTYQPNSRREKIQQWIGSGLEDHFLNNFDHIFSLNQRLKIALSHRIDAAKLSVTPSGIDEERFEACTVKQRAIELWHQWQLPTDKIVITCIARLVRQKGVEYFIKALTYADNWNAIVLIVGTGPLLATLQEQARAVRIPVFFTGSIPHRDVAAVLSRTRIFVMPSIYEELGTALIEAMYSGCTVVASRVGGIVETLRNGELGELVPPAAPRKLYESIDSLLRHPDNAQLLAQRAQYVAAKQFAWQHNAARVERIYYRVVGSR